MEAYLRWTTKENGKSVWLTDDHGQLLYDKPLFTIPAEWGVARWVEAFPVRIIIANDSPLMPAADAGGDA